MECIAKFFLVYFLNDLPHPPKYLKFSFFDFYSNFNRQTENDISSDEEEISFDYSDTDTVTITNEIYQRLMQASVDVYKANENIKKLNGIISYKDAKIKELQKEVSVMKRKVMNMDKLSNVSFH